MQILPLFPPSFSLSLSLSPFPMLCASFRAHVCTRDFRVTILDFIVISLPGSVPFFSLCFSFFFFSACLGKGMEDKVYFVEKKKKKKKTKNASKSVGRVGERGVAFFYLQNNLRVIVMFIKGMNSILERMNEAEWMAKERMELKVKSYSILLFYINIFISWKANRTDWSDVKIYLRKKLFLCFPLPSQWLSIFLQAIAYVILLSHYP